MEAQIAAPKYKKPPESTGPMVLLFNKSLEIGVLIDEQIAAIIAKTIPILVLFLMRKVYHNHLHAYTHFVDIYL